MLFVITFGFTTGILWPLLLLIRGRRLRRVEWGAVRLAPSGNMSRLGAELCMACLLVLSTIGLLRNASWSSSLHVFSLGMLVYSALRNLGDRRGWFIIATSLVALMGAAVSASILFW